MSSELLEEQVDETTVVKEGFLRCQRKKILLFFALILILAGIVFLWHMLQLPARGSIRVSVPQKQPELFEENQEKKLYQGKFLEFSYRAFYAEKSHEIIENGPVRERIWLITPDIEGRKIAIVVAKREGNALTSDPSYVMRQNDKKSYQSMPLSGMNFEGVVFQDHVAPFEAVAFFKKEGYIVSVSLTSLFKKDDLDGELSRILESTRFPLW